MSDSGHDLVYSREEPEDCVHEDDPDGRISLIDEDGDEEDFWPAWNRTSDGSTTPTIKLDNNDADDIIDTIWQHGIDSLTIVDEEFDISVHDYGLTIHKPARKIRPDGGSPDHKTEPDPDPDPDPDTASGAGQSAVGAKMVRDLWFPGATSGG